MNTRRNKTEREEKRQPDGPVGLEYTAAKNRGFAERIVGIIRLRLKEAGYGRR